MFSIVVRQRYVVSTAFDPAVTSHADVDRLPRTEPQVQLTPFVLNNHSSDFQVARTFLPATPSVNAKTVIHALHAKPRKTSLLRGECRDRRYVVDLRHPLQAPCEGNGSGSRVREDLYSVVEAVGMWESRRDFQRVWEGWEAGFMAFHAFHTLSFPWPAYRAANAR